MYRILIIFFSSLVLFSCAKEDTNKYCFNIESLNEVIYLNNPEFINLQVIGGSVKTQLSNRTILIIRNNNNYKAFDLQCPELDCSQPLNYDGLKLTCNCSKKEYNSLNGSPIDGNGCFVNEYETIDNGKTLQIIK